MFTGLIQDVGSAVSLEISGREARLVVRTGLRLADVDLGASVAVDGACLTVTEKSGDTLAFVISEETLRCTTFGALVPGQRVNLEAALRMGDPLGGHLVQGHVDGVGAFVGRQAIEGGLDLTYRVPEDLLDTVIVKGSITLDGVSLTVASLEGDLVMIAVIPHTVEHTNLLDRQPGGPVNVETDLIGKYVRRCLRHSLGAISTAGDDPGAAT